MENIEILEGEIWKDAPGYEKHYMVSNLGRVYSKHTKKLRAFSQDHGGYDRLTIMIRKEGINCSVGVHRLVAQAFIPNPDNLPEVNHKDENKHNNAASNLEWCSRAYNANYGTIKERISKALGKPIIQLSLDGQFIARYDGAKQAARQLGFSDTPIINCANKNYKTSYGFKWVWENEYLENSGN